MRRKSWLYLGVMAVWVVLMFVWLVPIGIQHPAMAVPLLISVAALVWALALSPFTDYRAQWAIYPVLVAFLAVIVMHGFLVVRGPFRLAMVFYAVTHLVLWIPFGFLCVILITKEGPDVLPNKRLKLPARVDCGMNLFSARRSLSAIR